MSVSVLSVVLPMLLAINGAFELLLISMAVNDDRCHGRVSSGNAGGPGGNSGALNSCAVNMGTVAAVFVAIIWAPLALESYRHRGRSVSVDGVGCIFTTAA